jgi:copper chaperone CopZ
MKKTFKMENLDCANCAAKMEDLIKKIDGVENAVVSFMAQKMSITADENRFDEILPQICAAVAKVDRHCSVVLK